METSSLPPWVERSAWSDRRSAAWPSRHFSAAGAVAADIGLIGTAAWLISRAAQHPNEAALALAIVAVQFFGLVRGFFRYGERLVGHDAAFRLLADLRVQVYERLERLAPAGLPIIPARRSPGPDRSGRRLPTGPAHPGHPALRHRRDGRFGSRWPLCGGCCRVPPSSWPWPWFWPPPSYPGSPGPWPGAGSRAFAAVRGDLAAAMVDLTEGAAELIAFGATGAHVRAIRERDAELTAISAGVGRDRRHRAWP